MVVKIKSIPKKKPQKFQMIEILRESPLKERLDSQYGNTSYHEYCLLEKERIGSDKKRVLKLKIIGAKCSLWADNVGEKERDTKRRKKIES